MTDESLPAHDSAAPDNPTRQSLIMRLRGDYDEAAWNEFFAVYSPLLYEYARARGWQPSDADDIRSECLAAIVRQMPGFVYDSSRGGFRAWMRTIAIRRMIDRQRRRPEVSADSRLLQNLADDHNSPDELWDREWRHHLLCHCLDEARSRVNEKTWNIFQSLLDGETSVEDVCRTFQVTQNHVYKARARVLGLIRERLLYIEASEDA